MSGVNLFENEIVLRESEFTTEQVKLHVAVVNFIVKCRNYYQTLRFDLRVHCECGKNIPKKYVCVEVVLFFIT